MAAGRDDLPAGRPGPHRRGLKTRTLAAGEGRGGVRLGGTSACSNGYLELGSPGSMKPYFSITVLAGLEPM